jgi:DNA repair protein RecO (recombination protein O)
MPYWTSLSIVLRAVDYGETSQIVGLFSRERGRISAIAKGSKRKGSKLAGAIEPITLCETVCFKGRDTASMHTLAELDVRETFRGARQDLRRLHAAAYVIEVLREAAPEEQALPEVFDVAAAALRRIADGPEGDARQAVIAFEARLLELLGLFPRIDACVDCGAPSARGGAARVAFSARLGGVLCEACRARKDRTARDVSWGALEVLAKLGREPAKVAHLRLLPPQQAELRGLLDGYLAGALDRELKLAKLL